MRIMSLLATCATIWALSVGALWAHQVPETVPFVGEVSLCLVPMGSAAPPFGSCSDHTSPWLGIELNPD